MSFGQKILEKYGFKQGAGLGKHENGITEPIKANYKVKRNSKFIRQILKFLCFLSDFSSITQDLVTLVQFVKIIGGSVCSMKLRIM